MARTSRVAAAAATLLLALSACSGAAEDTVATPEPEAAPLLEEHGLDGMSGREIVDHLDRLGGAERPADLMASVRPAELIVSDGTEELAVALPEDEFYLSVAPYVDSSHECFFHSLTTCQGELAEADIEVTFTTADGEVLLEETTTTFANGFAGFWLPRDVEGVLEVTHDGRSGQVLVATGEEDPTCLTTLQLS
ncbi:CueP family metal-binding protein [Georgenia satyanarayanai]|uniref:CueP family metal-binding protein n=1 Tax=Georgenia satyanarayanai TaxID=860221 RepID=UPI0020417463|nr:CueP family metal-binding protein [Georgenia satyanarayanai]MCM3662154.1 CueP family metal-binding protein [Georgenia satyanarayanai]